MKINRRLIDDYPLFYLSLPLLLFFLALFFLLLPVLAYSDLTTKEYRYYRVYDNENKKQMTLILDPYITIDTRWLKKSYGLILDATDPSHVSHNEDIFYLRGGAKVSKSMGVDAKLALESDSIIGMIRAALAISSLTREEKGRPLSEEIKHYKFTIEIPYQRAGNLSALLNEVVSIINKLRDDQVIFSHQIRHVVNPSDRNYGLRIDLYTPSTAPGSGRRSIATRSQQRQTLARHFLSACRYQFFFVGEDSKTYPDPKELRSLIFSLGAGNLKRVGELAQKIIKTNTSAKHQIDASSPGLNYFAPRSIIEQENTTLPIFIAMDNVLDKKHYVKLSGITLASSFFDHYHSIHLPEQLDYDSKLIELLNQLLANNITLFKGKSFPTLRYHDSDRMECYQKVIFEQKYQESIDQLVQRVSMAQNIALMDDRYSMMFSHASYTKKNRFNLVFIAKSTATSHRKAISDDKQLKKLMQPYATLIHSWCPVSIIRIDQPGLKKFPTN